MSVPCDSDRAREESWSATRIAWRIPGDRSDFVIHSDDDAESILESAGSVSITRSSPITHSQEESSFLGSLDQVLDHKAPLPDQGLIKTLLQGSEDVKIPEGSGLQAAVIADWVGSHGTLDDRTNANVKPGEFVRSGLKGNAKSFAELTVSLLKAKGISARLAEGYFVPGEQSPDNQLLITDEEKCFWPEILTSSGVWIPLPVHPVKVESQGKPSQQEDRKKEIFDALSKKHDIGKTQQRGKTLHAEKPPWSSIGYGALAMLALTFAFPITRTIRDVVMICKQPAETRGRVLLQRIAAIYARSGQHRAYGQTWESYMSDHVARLNPARAGVLQKVLERCSIDQTQSVGKGRALVLYFSSLFWGFVPKRLQFINQH
jgi:hypothetical protein